MNYKKLKRVNTFLVEHPRWRQLLAFGVLAVVFTASGVRRFDPDFGWHLAAGDYIRHHGIPVRDIYSYTAQSFRWINHEWGNDVLLSLVYGLGGYNLVAFMYGLIWSAGMIIAGARTRIFVLLSAATAVLPYAGVRPLAWSLLFFAITIQILRSSQTSRRWWLVPLFVVWANIHAGFIAGFGLLVYFLLRDRTRKIALILVVCVLATLCNVYGWRIYEEIARTLFDPQLHQQIAEWTPFSILAPSWFFLILYGTGFWMFDRKKLKKWFGTSPLLFVASLSATRNLPMFVVSATKEVDEYFEKVRKAIPKKLDRPRKVVLGALCLGLAAGLLFSLHLAFGDWHSDRDAIYPSKAVAYLRQHPCDGNLFNSYNYGGYLIWKLPGQKVYIDGRMPTWKPYMENYERIINKPKNYYQTDFAQHNIRCVLVSGGDSGNLVPLLEKAHWTVAVKTPGQSVLMVAPKK